MRTFLLFMLSLLVTVPAFAADRVFSFPYIKMVRGFDTTDHPQSFSMTGGVAPHARLPIGPVAQGATVRIYGSASAVSGTVNISAGGNLELQIVAPGDFDQTFTLANATDYIQITGGTYDTATITAFYVEVS